MAYDKREIDFELYENLVRIASAVVDREDAEDVTNTAVLNTLTIRGLYPNKSILELLREALAISFASLYFSRREENYIFLHGKEAKLKSRGYSTVDAHFSIQYPLKGMSDIERLIALEMMTGSNERQIADKHNVTESCITSFCSIIEDRIKHGIYDL